MEYTFYQPNGNAVLTSVEEKEVNKVTISCGGGMGGSRWEEYGNFDKLDSNKLCKFKDEVFNKEKIINTAFVVEVEEVKLIKVTWDTTNHANFHEKKCNRQIKEIYYVIPKDGEYEILEKYSDKDNNLKIKTKIQTYS